MLWFITVVAILTIWAMIHYPALLVVSLIILAVFVHLLPYGENTEH